MGSAETHPDGLTVRRLCDSLTVIPSTRGGVVLSMASEAISVELGPDGTITARRASTGSCAYNPQIPAVACLTPRPAYATMWVGKGWGVHGSGTLSPAGTAPCSAPALSRSHRRLP